MSPRFFAFFCLLVAADGVKVTPVEKVIQLLKGLSVKVIAEGKEEAAAYDKYACFCKEQSDNKLYAIEKSEKKLKELDALMTKLDAEIAELDKAVMELNKKIDAKEHEVASKTEVREKEHAEYLVKAKDMDEAISACERAIEALRDSKKQLKGAKLNLAQVTSDVVKAVHKQPAIAQTTSAVSLLAKLNQPGQAAKYQYQSNDIIATLEDLLTDLKGMKTELDNQEFDVNSVFESEVQGLNNEIKFAKKEKAEKEAISAGKTEELEEAHKDATEEAADMHADQSFLDELTSACEEKAHLFDQRSKTRADEVQVLAEATVVLEKGAAPNYEANKLLVGLQKQAAPSSSPVTFVQVHSVQQHKSGHDNAMYQRVVDVIDGAAIKLSSRVLSTLSLRVKVSEDHFAKVRMLIRDLVETLEKQAAEEAEQKSFCDKEMGAAIADRDESQSKIEACNAEIAKLQARQDELEAEIAELTKQVAELKKALLEATELRKKEKADNMKTIEMASDGAEATKMALTMLQSFYGSALLQQMKYVPPNSDRDGNTVGDLAPKAFESDYHGQKDEAHGIIGIIEVILTDFERTIKETTDAENDAQTAFETFEKKTVEDIDAKSKSIKDKEGELINTKAKILDEQNALKDATDMNENALDTLSKLEAQCVAKEETWEERTKKRNEEIEALKSALAILEDWKGAPAENTLDDAPDREQI